VTDPKALSWNDMMARSKSRGFLAKQLFAIETTPIAGVGPIEANLVEHLKYQVMLEESGAMFAAGPLCDVATQTWQGRGLVVVRAASYEAAKAIAEADPMHANGARSYTVTPWLVNEGVVDLRITYSNAHASVQ
jgi:uncharacterized protein YciI